MPDRTGLLRLVRRLALVIAGAVALGLISKLLSPAAQPLVVEANVLRPLAGVVQTTWQDKRIALPGAHVLLEVTAASSPPAARTTLTDIAGVFALQAPPSSESYRLLVRAPTFEPYEDTQWRPGQAATVAVDMRAKPQQSSDRQFEKIQSMMSGDGANFSTEYVVCSDDIPNGLVIKKYSFELHGDRQCGSWSTCQLKSSTPTKVCFAVRLQGHNECGAIPFGANCARARESLGVLRLVVAAPTESLPTRTVFLQYAPGLKEKAFLQICPALLDRGFVCVDPVQTHASGASRVVYFSDEDADAARTIVAILAPLTGSQLSIESNARSTAGVSGGGGGGRFEVWLSK